eukprot:symbB.v1.2.004190.t1/scaffold233.1/size288367/21
MALICFSFHRTAPESVILNFFDLAKEKGLEVRDFGEKQLPPRCRNMALARSYVFAKSLQFAEATKLNYGNLFEENVGMVDVGDLWLKVKKEIKEELERDMRSSNFDDFDQTLRKVVEVKDETEKDIEDHQEPHKTSEVAVKQEVGQLLTGKVQVAAGTEGLSSEKKQSDAHDDGPDDGVKIKEENVPEDPAAAARSLDDFASQAATWAKECLAFRSSKTWSPTRQCPRRFVVCLICKYYGCHL